MEGAIYATFGDMNSHFAELRTFELSNFAPRSIKAFLGKFDAIFTDPRGLSVFDPPPTQQIRERDPLLDLRFVGVSTRTLRDTFSGDDLQLDSLGRFLR
jgi:hypothetical protein